MTVLKSPLRRLAEVARVQREEQVGRREHTRVPTGSVAPSRDPQLDT
jgi:hypothetical protein